MTVAQGKAADYSSFRSPLDVAAFVATVIESNSLSCNVAKFAKIQ
jgi:hypothetical protein